MSLKLVVLGSNGFVGSRLCLKLSTLKTFYVTPTECLPLDKIILFDVNESKDEYFKGAISADSRCEFIIGDLCRTETIMRVLDPENKYTRVTVIHLAAILSGYCEKDFDLGMKVNLYGSLNVIECLRQLRKRKKILNDVAQIYFYSSTDYTICFNEANRVQPSNEESYRLSPVSYGCQKACMEILISDYTRKGFIDGRVGRFAAVIGRAGYVDVLSYAWHGTFTQTLVGKDYECGLPMNIGLPCCSITNVVKNVIFLCGQVDADEIGHNRTVCVPAKTLTLQTIWEETKNVAKQYGIFEKIGKIIRVKRHGSTVNEINVVPMMDYSKAKRLGLDVNVDINEIITDFVENYVKVRYSNMFTIKSKL